MIWKYMRRTTLSANANCASTTSLSASTPAPPAPPAPPVDVEDLDFNPSINPSAAAAINAVAASEALTELTEEAVSAGPSAVSKDSVKKSLFPPTRAG